MRNAIPAILVLAALLALANTARGQSVGPVLGYEYGLPLAIERAPGVVNSYGTSGDGRSQNHTVFAGLRLDLPFEQTRLAISSRLGFALSTGHFTSDSFTVAESITRPSVTTREYDVVSTVGLVRADALLRLGLGPRVAVMAGPWTSLRLTSGFYQTERILGPGGAIYRDSTTRRAVAAGDDLGSSAVRLGAAAGLGFDVPIAGTRVSFELLARVDAGALVDGLAARSISGALMLSLSPVSVASASAVAMAAAALPAPADSAARLSASIDIVPGHDEVLLTSTSTHHRLEIWTPRWLQFAHGAATIPEGVERLTRSQALAFRDADLTRMTPETALRRGLDLVGYRLRQHQTERLRIVGSIGGGEPQPLARERAERLSAYFIEVWGVAPERLEVSATAGHGASGVALQLAPGLAAAPVAIEWIERAWNAPRLAPVRSVDASAGVRSWSIELRQGGREVARYDDDLAGTRQRFTLSGERPLRPLTAELTVEDSVGRVVVARDTVTVRSTTTGDPDRERIAAVLPPGDDLPALLQTVVRRIRAGARVVMHPVGAPSSSRVEAQRVAELLLQALRRAQVSPDEVQFRLAPVTVGPFDAVIVEIDQPAANTPEVLNETRGG